MMVLDSNVWIAWFNESDIQHTEAVRIFSSTSSPIIAPESVVVEVSSVLLKKAGKKIADQFLRLVSDNADIILLCSNEDFLTKVIDKFLSVSTKKLSLVDIMLLVLSEKHIIVTFDRDLAKEINISQVTFLKK
jgi:predicted nucleic acid-binding protein